MSGLSVTIRKWGWGVVPPTISARESNGGSVTDMDKATYGNSASRPRRLCVAPRFDELKKPRFQTVGSVKRRSAASITPDGDGGDRRWRIEDGRWRIKARG